MNIGNQTILNYKRWNDNMYCNDFTYKENICKNLKKYVILNDEGENCNEKVFNIIDILHEYWNAHWMWRKK